MTTLIDVGIEWQTIWLTLRLRMAGMRHSLAKTESQTKHGSAACNAIEVHQMLHIPIYNKR